MNPEEFRHWGHRLIDWLADYRQHVTDHLVQSRTKPGEIRAQLPPAAPGQPEPFEQIFADFEKIVMPGITHWQSPHFHAYFPANNSGPSILGELLSAGLGVQGMLWSTSPACTELESHMLDWMADMLALPAKFKFSSSGGGVIQDSASSAVLCAMLAAREAATQFQSNARGCTGRLVAYTSTQAHSSVEKAAMIAGIGKENLRLIRVDDTFAISPPALQAQIASDRAAGLQPFFISITVGTTSSNAFDPIDRIGAIAKAEGLWLHVDGAMCGTAALCPEFRWIHRGLESADSYCFNPHKWMFTNFDCDCFYVANRAALIRALSILPEYLRNKASESGQVVDYRDWQIPLGRRFRALKLWFVIRSYGVAGLQQVIREHVALGQQFAEWISKSKQFELAAPAPLNLVCFRDRQGDAATRALLDKLNQRGRIFLTHTLLRDRFTLRFCIGQTDTKPEDLQFACREILEAAEELPQS